MLAFIMHFTTLTLPNLYLPKQRQPARSAQQKLAEQLAKLKQKSFIQFGGCFERFIPIDHLTASKSGRHSRNRVFSKQNTFWAFLSQVLDAEGGCKEVVLKFQSFVAKRSGKAIACSTSAYCQARKNLDEVWLEGIFKHLSQQLSHAVCKTRLQGRRVIVVDGTGLSMPDTVENQEKWPQQKHQKPGCGARNLLKICQTKNVMSWFAFYINQLLEISSWKDREGVNLEQSNEGPKTINY